MRTNITLTNGENVELVEAWVIDKILGSYDLVEIYDEDGELIGSYNGSLSVMDDEDFDMEEFVKMIEQKILE